MAQPFEASLPTTLVAERTPRGFPTVAPRRRFIVGWTLAWGLIGCAVAAGFAFGSSIAFLPALKASILFAEVVGFSAFVSARMIFPLFSRLPYWLRLILEILTLISATLFGSILVIAFQPLFSLAQPRALALIVLANALLAVVVGISLSTYERMRGQLEASMRQIQEKQALERELDIAREVQRELLPRSAPEIEGVELAGVCLPAKAVGGDYYDFLKLQDGRLGLVVADVSGKGVGAALHMACLQASVRSLFRTTADVGALNALLNQHLFESTAGSRYATLFAAEYEVATRTLEYSNAGHQTPLIVRKQSVVRLDQGGVPLGLFEGPSWDSERLTLKVGDLLALFTDGISEAPKADDEDLDFGEQRLVEILQRYHDRPLDELIERAQEAVKRWTGEREAHDDLTLVLVRIR